MNTKTILLGVLFLVCNLISFISGMEYKSYQLRKILKATISDIVKTDNTVVDKITQQPKKIILKNIDEEIELATINYTIHGSEEVKTFGVNYSNPIVPKAGAKLVVVNLSITNTTKEPFFISSSEIGSLIDDQDRLFLPYSNYLGDKGIAGDLAPSIKKTGYTLIEIPENSNGYSFVFSKAGTNEEYRTKLK